MRTTKILVLCTGNSARSQMGEGLFRAEGASTIYPSVAARSTKNAFT